jgi:CheY-like chemotaxis protein
MSDIDGIALGKAIRSESFLNDTQLIMLAAFDERERSMAALSAGYAAYITKPVKQARLLETIGNVLSQPGAVAPHDETESRARPAPAPDSTERIPSHTAPLILVVEDNRFNQAVAREQVARLSYRADIVANGIDAVERLCQPQHGYRLVLMDCQMPGMDGFAATMAVRAWEHQHGGHVPIIAMTAQALEGDRERCIAAGMDDYITKPVRFKNLNQVLGRWLAATIDEDATLPPPTSS